MFEKTLICTDLADGLQRLVHCVPSLTGSGVKQVIFLHSIPVWEQPALAKLDEEKIESAREKLAPALKDLPEGISVSVEISNRRPVDAVREILKVRPVDAIVMASAPRSSWEAKVFGSTSLEVARATDVPLLLFRPPLLATYTRDELALRCEHLWKHLLIPHDGSDRARYLVEQIERYARGRVPGSFERCTLLRVVEDSSRDRAVIARRLEDGREELEKVAGALEALGLQVSVRVSQGTAIPEILKAAGEEDICAIAIATDHRNNVLEWLTARGIGEEILHQLWFPLLFFSPAR
jgi:nucleotide-binding universal stress UspA family protein